MTITKLIRKDDTAKFLLKKVILAKKTYKIWEEAINKPCEKTPFSKNTPFNYIKLTSQYIRSVEHYQTTREIFIYYLDLKKII